MLLLFWDAAKIIRVSIQFLCLILLPYFFHHFLCLTVLTIYNMSKWVKRQLWLGGNIHMNTQRALLVHLVTETKWCTHVTPCVVPPFALTFVPRPARVPYQNNEHPGFGWGWVFGNIWWWWKAPWDWYQIWKLVHLQIWGMDLVY